MENKYDYIGNIIAYEDGQLDKPGIVELFQYLIDYGYIQGLQGHYHRVANALVDAGLVSYK